MPDALLKKLVSAQRTWLQGPGAGREVFCARCLNHRHKV